MTAHADSGSPSYAAAVKSDSKVNSTPKRSSIPGVIVAIVAITPGNELLFGVLFTLLSLLTAAAYEGLTTVCMSSTGLHEIVNDLGHISSSFDA